MFNRQIYFVFGNLLHVSSNYRVTSAPYPAMISSYVWQSAGEATILIPFPAEAPNASAAKDKIPHALTSRREIEVFSKALPAIVVTDRGTA